MTSIQTASNNSMAQQPSLWARRMASKAAVTKSDVNATFHRSSHSWGSGKDSSSDFDVNVLSLILEMPLAKLESMRLPVIEDGQCSSGSRSSKAVKHLQNSSKQLYVEVQTAQTAVKAALHVMAEDQFDKPCHLVLETNSLSTSYAQTRSGQLLSPTSPLSPLSPLSPADSNFTATDSESPEGGEPQKRKGRARMSQEKRKRLARRREREALIAAMQSYANGGPSPLLSQLPNMSSLPMLRRPSASSSSGMSSPRLETGLTLKTSFSPWYESSEHHERELPSPALTIGSVGTESSLNTPQTSPCKSDYSAQSLDSGLLRLPTLVVEPPSPQRLGLYSGAHATGYKTHGHAISQKLMYQSQSHDEGAFTYNRLPHLIS